MSILRTSGLISTVLPMAASPSFSFLDMALVRILCRCAILWNSRNPYGRCVHGPTLHRNTEQTHTNMTWTYLTGHNIDFRTLDNLVSCMCQVRVASQNFGHFKGSSRCATLLWRKSKCPTLRGTFFRYKSS